MTALGIGHTERWLYRNECCGMPMLAAQDDRHFGRWASDTEIVFLPQNTDF